MNIEKSKPAQAMFRKLIYRPYLQYILLPKRYIVRHAYSFNIYGTRL